MKLLLIFTLLSAITGILFSVNYKTTFTGAFATRERLVIFIKAFYQMMLVLFFLCTVWYFMSWLNYIFMKQNLAAIETRAAELNIYTSQGLNNIGNNNSKALTDLVYNSYQVELSRKARELRYVTENYNNTLVGKRVLKEGVMGVITVGPDPDMKMYDLSQFIMTKEMK